MKTSLKVHKKTMYYCIILYYLYLLLYIIIYHYILNFILFSFLLYIISKKILVGHEMDGSQQGAPSMDPPLLYTVKCVTTSVSTDILEYIELKKIL